MRKLYLIPAAIILFFGFACSERSGREKNIGDLSGKMILDEDEKNRILEFYSASEDSLKKKAVAFLLEHISAHYSNESPVLETINREYSKRKSKNKDADPYKTFSSVLKSVHERETRFERVCDERFISGDYLIDNVEQAFEVWGNKTWSENIDFETFCEYILPYRIMDEPLDYDREYFRKGYTPLVAKEEDLSLAFDNVVKASPVRYSKPMDKVFPYLTSVGLNLKIGIGNCVQQTVSEVMLLRSVGIPASVDYVPQWGNYSGRHFMTKLIGKEKQSSFDLSWSDFKPIICVDSLPEGISAIQYAKTIPKVYRMAWSVQPERKKLNSGDKFEQTGLFRNLYEKDVTDEYTECSIFNLQVEDTIDNIAYLCVFGKDDWMPVCAAPINTGLAVFEKVGRKVVYLPAMYKQDDAGRTYMQPIGNPFYFTSEGTCVTLAHDGKKNQWARLYSKYPVHSYTATHAYKMKGGQFQGANNSDFSDARTLFTIDYYPFYRQEVKIENDEKFRYFRYLPPHDGTYSLAELQFHTQDNSGSPQQIEGTYFERYKSGTSDFAALKDNDLDTYVMGIPVRDSWIAYDTGKNDGSRLLRIVFAPQNDGNCIISGYFYELCYWQGNNWTSLGVKQAKTNSLEYSGLPRQALFRLKCHSRGTEERIFTIENGIQVWW